MTQQDLVHVGFELPTPAEVTTRMQAIKVFQALCRQELVEGHDYGIIPGTGNKPTLLKPGAEKIAKLLSLADEYEVVDRQESWDTDKPFFRYLIRCKLTHMGTGTLVATGLGECNSMESKYRWRGRGENRRENDDIFSQVNTLLKMAKKRALVDASLSAGRLSDVFTQDLDEMPREAFASDSAGANSQSKDAEYGVCDIHNVPYFKSPKMRSPAHRTEDGGWCNAPKSAPQATAQRPTPPTPAKDDATAFFSTARSMGLSAEHALAKLGVADYAAWEGVGKTLTEALARLEQA